MTDTENTDVNVGRDLCSGDGTAVQPGESVDSLKRDIQIMREVLGRIKTKLDSTSLDSDADRRETDKLRYELMQLAVVDDGQHQRENVDGGNSVPSTSQSHGIATKVSQQPNDSESSDETTSEDDTSTHQRVKSTKSRIKVQPPSETDPAELSVVNQNLVDALRRLDARTAPKPESFSVTSGYSLSDFFGKFEEYCESKYNCNPNGWIPELGRNLQGEVHGIFEALRGPTDSYADIKAKLTKWYKESKSIRKANQASLFNSAQMMSRESLYVYGARLEKLFKGVFPKKSVEKSHTLRQKYLDTVPSDFRQQIETSLALATVNGQALTWSQILRIAAIRDNSSVGKTCINPDVPECYNVVGNMSNPPKRFADCETQSDFGNRMFSEAVGAGDTLQARDSRNCGRTAGFRNQNFTRNFNTGESANYHSNYNANRSSNRAANETGIIGACSYCGKTGHSYSVCRKRLKLCLTCGSKEHFKRNCKQKWQSNSDRTVQSTKYLNQHAPK